RHRRTHDQRGRVGEPHHQAIAHVPRGTGGRALALDAGQRLGVLADLLRSHRTSLGLEYVDTAPRPARSGVLIRAPQRPATPDKRSATMPLNRKIAGMAMPSDDPAAM